MRLISAHIRGYGRIVDSKVNLDAKVIAIVGPNEAGKTTLLNALAFVDRGGSIPLPERSRAAETTDDTLVTTLDYVLDGEDQEALADLDLQELPTRARIARTASGEHVQVTLTPIARKSVKPLAVARDVLAAVLSRADLDDLIDRETVYADPNGDAPRDYRAELQLVADAVGAAVDEPGTALPEEVVATTRSLLGVTATDALDAADLIGAYSGVLTWAERDAPAPEARDRIWKRTPRFVLFGEEDRSIQSTYNLDQVASPPRALANLARMASLDLAELHQFIQSGDTARRRSAIVKANRRMDALFEEAWKQSRLSVHFEVDGGELRVELMEDGDNVTVFAERSAGLRMFIALIAFLKVHGTDELPVLLIDEAENHLHIDAQADLVNMFVTQQQAVKVIYTTHSPACLPPDLGTGIRVVAPRPDNLQISDVKNSFWQGTAGYSPLMMAMGAAAAAFTPARRVVLAEGATEMILLPTLMRTALGVGELPYQVAAGLAEAPNDLLSKLDLEAARVAYLVDGDDGGKKLAKALSDVGVPERLIAELSTPGIENVIDAGCYGKALTALVLESNPGLTDEDLVSFAEITVEDGASIAKAATNWIEKKGWKAPSKVAVASWLVTHGTAVPSEAGRELLSALHQRLLSALGVPTEESA
ncbi:AAA family ATPase [Microbacterium sp. SS28]|uniref:AAA family ATPase n=1 Tax=Microbacterium sp. SS28 TaxID=2919948 RepID=UPI001FA94588|nr:AAA family ATPase [Microbacterium sp. SS28]